MRFSKHKFPALDFVHNTKSKNPYIHSKGRNEDIDNACRDAFEIIESQPIKYIPQTIHEFLFKNKSRKDKNVFFEIGLKQMNDCVGVFLMWDGLLLTYKYIKVKRELSISTLVNDTILPFQFFIKEYDKTLNEIVWSASKWTDDSINKVGFDSQVMFDVANRIFTIKSFMEFSDIETQELDRKKYHVQTKNGSYTTDFDFPITIVDSKWNINSISGPFGVKGHWRKQRHGVGSNQIKMIWIEGFVKKGYHKKAKAIDYRENG